MRRLFLLLVLVVAGVGAVVFVSKKAAPVVDEAQGSGEVPVVETPRIVEEETAAPEVAARGGLPKLGPQERVAAARGNAGERVRGWFQAAGVRYPGEELYLRAFKAEGQVELWARDEWLPFRLIHTFQVTCRSGQPGPKRREGDRQVPEGFYHVDRHNPASLFHLSLGLNYPNEADRILGDREKPGFDIFIHGGEASVGCLPIGDAPVEELFVIAEDHRLGGNRRIRVHIFPHRMGGAAWANWEAENGSDALRAFWAELQPMHDAFERTRMLPEFRVAPDGRYQVERH